MQELSLVLTPLSIAAGLALGVERTIEILKHMMQSDISIVSKSIKISQPDRIQAIKRINNAVNQIKEIDKDPALLTPTSKLINFENNNKFEEISKAADSESDEFFPPPRIEIKPVTKKTTLQTSKIVFIQLIAAGLGVILAHVFEIKLLTVFMNSFGLELKTIVQNLDYIFTGLVIGGGSQPIHLLIRLLTNRNLTNSNTSQRDEIRSSAETNNNIVLKDNIANKTSLTDFNWKNVSYDGGINPSSLNNNHRRSGEPNLIVYHHTAMSDSDSFQDVVDEFLVTKKWLTGYHCVVMPDGTIEPFCRWDRAGNHTKGKNARSLGIAFHGNYHTEVDKFSNADGRYGNKTPPDAQLHAGARIIALWLYLYDKNSFESILSHQDVMAKGYTVCPGSNFPDDKLKNLIQSYYKKWSISKEALLAITEFKQRNFIYAN